jgi:hypothetical protein
MTPAPFAHSIRDTELGDVAKEALKAAVREEVDLQM